MAAKAMLDAAVKAVRSYQMGEDGTALGKGASFEAAENAILGMKSDADPAGSKISPLKLRSVKQTKKSVKVTWSKSSGAVKYIIYGNKCGKKNKMKKLTTTTKSTINFKKIAGKKLKKATYYKFIVVAVDANNDVVSTSKVVHAATKGGKAANPKKVVINSPKKAKKTVQAGKSFSIKAKQTKPSKKTVKKHRTLIYESSNTSVAAVTKKGTVKAVAPGTCSIYVCAQNGIVKTIKVTVK